MECATSEARPKAVYISEVGYYDFDDDGKEEAYVTASTCMTGTAGPDIHAVYKMETSRTIVQLQITDGEGPLKIEGTPLPLIGNRNWSLGVENGRLVEEFYDGSGREKPLVRHFEFNGKSFVPVKDVYGPTYGPSFDCSFARSDREITVCGVPEMAKLDVELNVVFQKLLKTMKPGKQKRLIAEQRKWAKQLDKERAYKDFDERVVRPAYEKRIAELKSR